MTTQAQRGGHGSTVGTDQRRHRRGRRVAVGRERRDESTGADPEAADTEAEDTEAADETSTTVSRDAGLLRSSSAAPGAVDRRGCAVSVPDYPLPTVDGYQTYQLAQVATYVAQALARYRHARVGRAGVAQRGEALRELGTGMQALGRALGREGDAVGVPRPLDEQTYRQAQARAAGGARIAEVVALPEGDFAVFGNVPGLGPVGARTTEFTVAGALRSDFLVKPAQELAAWAVTQKPVKVPTVPQKVDLPAAIERLDPKRGEHRAVAVALWGIDNRTDIALASRFRGVDFALQGRRGAQESVRRVVSRKPGLRPRVPAARAQSPRPTTEPVRRAAERPARGA